MKGNLKDNVYWQLFQVAITAKHNLMDVAESYGLTVMQLYTLCLLEADKSIPMNSLSSTLSCDASNITGIVDRLLHQEYIKREENPKDRREKMITLSPKGTKICEKIAHAFEKDGLQSLQALTKEEKNTLSTILTKIFTTPKIG